MTDCRHQFWTHHDGEDLFDPPAGWQCLQCGITMTTDELRDFFNWKHGIKQCGATP